MKLISFTFRDLIFSFQRNLTVVAFFYSPYLRETCNNLFVVIAAMTRPRRFIPAGGHSMAEGERVGNRTLIEKYPLLSFRISTAAANGNIELIFLSDGDYTSW